MRKALYAGSFDPVHCGHLFLIDRATNLFDKLIVCVTNNPLKTSWLSLKERVEMMQAEIDTGYYGPVTVISSEKRLIRDVAVEQGCGWMVRGIRNAADFDAERAAAGFNAEVDDDGDSLLETVLLIAPPYLTTVSSTMIRSVVGLEGWPQALDGWVQETTLNTLKEKFWKC